jgi:anti-sigma factor RsiW
VSHLGSRLSALVDGELGGAERDRAYAHLAGCERCRAEAAELRALKKKLRGLVTGPPAEAEMTRRLLALTGTQRAAASPGPGGLPRRRRLRARPRSGPARRPPPRPANPRRRRYLVLGTVSLVVALGTAAFTAGGGGAASPGPRITPPVEMYSIEHAITTGEVPFPGPPAPPSDSPAP